MPLTIPFSAAQFFAVFARYNEAVWPAQYVLNAIAIVTVALLLWHGRAHNRLIAALLALLWLWMAIAYHFAFYSGIDPLAWAFGALFGAGAFAFVWLGVLQERLRFAPHGGVRGWIGGVLLFYGLAVYPLVGYALGPIYPAAPTFGLPCPTVIFTIGLLMFARAPLPRLVFVVPVLWSVVGTVAAVQLNMPQDYGLLAAGVAGLVAMLFPAPAEALPGQLLAEADQRGNRSGSRIGT